MIVFIKNILDAILFLKKQFKKSKKDIFLRNLFYYYELHLANQGDFLVDRKFTFEIGGKNKTTKQIQGVDDAYIVRDNMEVSGLNIIPLYLFGFLY